MLETLKKHKKKIFILFCLLLTFVGWFICFYLKKQDKDYSLYENGILLLLGAVGLLSGLFVEDLSYFLCLLCYLPFVFTHSFNNLNTPTFLYISAGMLLFSLVLHVFIYKNKFHCGNLFFGLALFCLSLPLGGVTNQDNPYLGLQIGMGLLLGFLIFVVYVFSTSSRIKNDFTVLVDIINGLSLLIALQFLTYLAFYPAAFSDKWIEVGCVGWGSSSNNVAMLLLLCLPFSFYRFCFGKRKFDFLYSILFYLDLGVIVLTYSKGGMIFAALGAIVMLIISIVHLKKECWKLFVPLAVIVVCGVVYLIAKPSLFETIISYLSSSFNFRTIETRFTIYKEYISMAMESPIFGKGLLYPLVSIIEEGNSYQWGHNTLLHTFYCLGFTGLFALLIHLVEKYYGVIKKMDAKKLTVFFAYLFSGLYGLMDVSYFFINYMIALLIIFIFADPYCEKIPYGKLFSRKEK